MWDSKKRTSLKVCKQSEKWLNELFFIEIKKAILLWTKNAKSMFNEKI